MGKSSAATANELLPEFQKFLRDKKLAPEKNVFFFALWASKFFNYTRKKQIPAESYQESAVAEFLEALKSDPHLADWQIRQASDAIRLYYFHYRGLKPLLEAGKARDAAPAGLLNETTRLLRLKHYSYSTERTYLQWIKRFFDYGMQTGEKGTAATFETDDFKNFISHLVLKEKVALIPAAAGSDGIISATNPSSPHLRPRCMGRALPSTQRCTPCDTALPRTCS